MTPPVLTAGSAPRSTPGIVREQVLPDPRPAELPTGVYVSAANHRYLQTKARRGRHTLELPSVLRSRSGDARSAESGAATRP